MKPRICFVAQFPPPVHGLSKAVDTLYHSRLAEEFDFEAVDLTQNKKMLSSLRAIRKSRADLFYFTISQSRGGNLRDLLILRLLNRRHKKCLIHLHGGYYRRLLDEGMSARQRKANLRRMAGVTGAIVLGPSLSPIFEGIVPEDRIYSVANCVDDRFLLSANALEQKAARAERNGLRRVLYLSNFIRSKGYVQVLELAAEEQKRISAGETQRFVFDFAGAFFDPEEQRYFEAMIREHQLSGLVNYHGVVTGDAKCALLAQSDLFMLWTTYPKEGQPISILEAMGNGLAVVTTDFAGIPDIVRDGENGIVAPAAQPFDAAALYERLCTLDYAQLARTNYAAVQAQFREQNYIDHMEAVFQKALDTGKQA